MQLKVLYGFQQMVGGHIYHCPKVIDPKLHFRINCQLALNKDKEEEEEEDKVCSTVTQLRYIYNPMSMTIYRFMPIRGIFICFRLLPSLYLLLACANYMNLAIARSVNRAREVGLRKVVGARHQQLIFQFLGESVLITFLALLLALGLTQLVLPTFGSVVETLLRTKFPRKQDY
jgi:hypothetical protein